MDTIEVDLEENFGDLPYNEKLDSEELPEKKNEDEGPDYEGMENDLAQREQFGKGHGPYRKNYRYQRGYRNRSRGRYDSRYQNPRESTGYGPYGRSNNYANRKSNRNTFEMDEGKKVKAKLVTLLDSFDTAKEDILSVCEDLKVLPENYNKEVTETFMKCVETFPVKTGAYASLVGLLKAAGKMDLVESINQQTLYNLGMNLSEGKRTVCVLLLRFLVGLHCANVTSNSVFDVLGSLIKLSSEVENFTYESNLDYTKSVITLDNLNYLVMASLPWFSREEFMKNVEAITSMCEKIFEYSERRARMLESLPKDLNFDPSVDLEDEKRRFNPYTYKYFYKDTVAGSLEDRFTTGVEAIRSLLKNDWTSSTTYRFYQSKGIVEKLREGGDQEENKVTADNLNSILHLDLKNFNNFNPVNAKNFNFNFTLDKSQMASVHDKWLFEEHVYNIFEVFGDDSLRCAQQLLAIPLNEEYKEYGIVDVLLNLALSKYHDNYYTIFGMIVMHNLCTLEEKTEDILYGFLGQVLAETDHLDANVLNTLINLTSFWFNMEFCKIRNSPEEIKVEGENADDLKKEMIREKNMRLFKTLFKPSNCPNNYNLRVIDKVSRLVYMDRLLTYSPRELEQEIKGLKLISDFRNKPYEHQLFLNLLHFNKLSPEENDLRNRRIVSFINNYTNKKYLKEEPKHLFSETKETKGYEEVVHEDEDVEVDESTGEKVNVQEEENPEKPRQEKEELWKRDDLIMLFWDTLLIFGSKSLTHLYRLFEFHSEVLKSFESAEVVSFEESVEYKVMQQTMVTFERDQKRQELSFDFFIRNNVFNIPLVLKFLMGLPREKVLTNFFFYTVNSVFAEIHYRLQNFREVYKVASRELAGTVAMEAKKKELDRAETDYFNLISLFVSLVNERMGTSDQVVDKVLEDLLLNNLVKYALPEKLVVKLYKEHAEDKERVKVTLFRLAMPSYLLK